MEVQEIIRRLQRDYKPDTQLLITWWDKAQFDLPDDDDMELTVGKWAEAVTELECDLLPYEERATNELSDILLGYLTEREVQA